jgi:hypothetical protein
MDIAMSDRFFGMYSSLRIDLREGLIKHKFFDLQCYDLFHHQYNFFFGEHFKRFGRAAPYGEYIQHVHWRWSCGTVLLS